MTDNLYNLYLENSWYLNYLDYEIILYLKNKYKYKKSIKDKIKNKKNKLNIIQKRLDLFEFPMICILSMYKGI